MALVKRTAKNQISLPKTLLERLPECDYFEADVEGQAIVLRPVKVVRLNQHENANRSLSESIGAGSRLFESPADVEAYIQESRSEWGE